MLDPWEVVVAKTKKTAVKATKTAKTTGATKASKEEITVDRRVLNERRENGERRSKDEPVSEERRRDQERRKTPRRRQIDPTTCERDYSDPEIEFMQAMDDYKRANGRMFPTCSEILEVLLSLGYEKPSPADELAGDDFNVAAGAGPDAAAPEAADLEAAGLEVPGQATEPSENVASENAASENVASENVASENVGLAAMAPIAMNLDDADELEQPPANEEI